MLVVVNLHGLRVDVRLQRINWIRQRQQTKWAGERRERRKRRRRLGQEPVKLGDQVKVDRSSREGHRLYRTTSSHHKNFFPEYGRRMSAASENSMSAMSLPSASLVPADGTRTNTQACQRAR